MPSVGFQQEALGVLEDTKLNMSQQCALVAKKASDVLGCIRRSVAALMRPHLECRVQFWAPQYRGDVDPGRLWSLLHTGDNSGNAGYSFLRRGSGEGGADLFSLGSSDRTRGNGSKLHQGRFRLGIRKHLFTKRVVKPWNRLPREMVDAPSLSVFKRHLDNALNSML
ncbi:hypothetical protein QYF61_010927 [Mycteria americana]|uniref:Uncharacterized protein n=1 Tax=Mycteria americana TaxID=33587 RepID=A0AAN7S362_MYCAM|nr:hypothetical protein QYF61_010927 [Mycteria americana]